MKNNKLPEQKTDLQLINSVKKYGDNDSFNEICKRYENIFYKICQKYNLALLLSGINIKDIFDEKNYVIYRCILSFKSKKNAKLSTWIGNCTRYLCLNTMNSDKLVLPMDSDEIKTRIEEKQATTDYSNNNKNYIENYHYIFNILNQLKDDRICNIFKYRYCGDKKMIWSKVAKKMNLSTQTVVNLHDKGVKLVKSKINSKNISDIV
jgi:hypothetical protein